MKKFTILAGLMALALFIGVAGSTFRADKAEARPTDVISFSPNVCISFGEAADWDAVIAPADNMLLSQRPDRFAPIVITRGVGRG